MLVVIEACDIIAKNTTDETNIILNGFFEKSKEVFSIESLVLFISLHMELIVKFTNEFLKAYDTMKRTKIIKIELR